MMSGPVLSLLQFHADLSRQEPVNVGVVLLHPDGRVEVRADATSARWPDQTVSPTRRSHIDLMAESHLGALKSALERTPGPEGLVAFNRRTCGAFALTDPRQIWADSLDELMDRLVGPPRQADVRLSREVRTPFKLLEVAQRARTAVDVALPQHNMIADAVFADTRINVIASRRVHARNPEKAIGELWAKARTFSERPPVDGRRTALHAIFQASTPAAHDSVSSFKKAFANVGAAVWFVAELPELHSVAERDAIEWDDGWISDYLIAS